MGRNPHFEEWVFDFKSLRDASNECNGILEILYAEYFEGWEKTMLEKADSLTERDKDGYRIIPE